MQTIGTATVRGKSVNICCGRFANGDRLAVLLETPDGEPYCRVAVNFPDVPLQADEFAVKLWSENEGLAEPLLATGLFESTGRAVSNGFVTAPVWRLRRPLPPAVAA